MKCSLCGYDFDGTRADAACKGCLMAKNCRLVRCPNCGYEMPRTPEWIKKFGKMLGRIFHRKNGKLK